MGRAHFIQQLEAELREVKATLEKVQAKSRERKATLKQMRRRRRSQRARLEAQVKELTRSLQAQPDAPPLPKTTPKARIEIDKARAARAADAPESVKQPALDRITPEHARYLVQRRCLSTNDGPVGCWTSKYAPHKNGRVYYSVNLQHAKAWDNLLTETDVRIDGKKIYLHQLSLIAGGNRHKLAWVNNKDNRFQASHLCHNKACFNPDHLVVEEAQRNRARNICQNHEILVGRGIRYHPCPHGGEGEKFVRCILPTRVITQEGVYSNENDNSVQKTPNVPKRSNVVVARPEPPRPVMVRGYPMYSSLVTYW